MKFAVAAPAGTPPRPLTCRVVTLPALRRPIAFETPSTVASPVRDSSSRAGTSAA